MTLPDGFFYALLCTLILGIAASVLIVVFWCSVGRILNDFWTKLGTEAVQIVCGVCSLYSAFAAASEKQTWFAPAAVGASALGAWKLTQLLADNRIKAADKADKRRLNEATIELDRRTSLVSAFRRAVQQKVKRLRKVHQTKPPRVTVAVVRSILRPASHLDAMLEAVGIFFQRQLPGGDGDCGKFRIGVYMEKAGALVPVAAADLDNPGYNPFTSFLAHPEYYKLATPKNPSIAVKCIRQQSTVIVEDCEKETGDGDFRFYQPEQRQYLKSIVAYYLGEICSEDGIVGKATLVIDTDQAGFFKKSERRSVEFYLREFATRIKLEMYLLALIAKKEVPHGNPEEGQGDQSGEDPETPHGAGEGDDS